MGEVLGDAGFRVLGGQRVWVSTRPVVAFLMATVLLGCSSSGEGSTSGARISTTTTVTTAVSGADGGTASTTGTASSPSKAGAINADPGARTALDHYLDALGANDFSAALAASRDALQALALVRSIVHAGNAERGGTTSSSFSERSLEVAAATPNEVRFTARVALTSQVSGASGPPVTTTDRLTNIVVRRDGNGWRAADATYNGKIVVSFPASATTTVGPVQLTLVGSIAFGGSVAVVVRLVSTGDHEVDVSNDFLRIGDEQATSTTRLLVSGQPGFLYLTYPRRDEHPTDWRATLTIDGTPHPITLAF